MRAWALTLAASLCLGGCLYADALKYTYDDAGRLVGVAYPNGSAITYTYDPAGNLLGRRVTATGPLITAAGVVNGASFVSGSVAPGEIATIFGSNLTSASGVNLTSSLPLPGQFLNVSVLVNGTLAPLFAVDNVGGQQQINFQVPWEVAGSSSATLQVVNNGAASASLTVPVTAAQPGIINYAATGGNYGVILHGVDYSLADSGHPAAAAETVLIYCTGLGAVSPQPATGAAGAASATAATVTVTIGGSNAQVDYSGLAPGFVGLNQINVEIPAGLSTGNQPVVVNIGGASSNTVLLPVQ